MATSRTKQFCETSFNNGKFSAELTASYQCVLRFFRSTCRKYDQRPDVLTALMNMSLVLRLPRKMHLCRSSSNVPRLPSFLEMLQNPHVLLTFDTVHNPLRLPHEWTSERQKVVRACCVFNVFTSKCASRHSRVRFFDISTSKSGPNLVRFAHFDFEICFAPQWRALFRQRNF